MVKNAVTALLIIKLLEFEKNTIEEWRLNWWIIFCKVFYKKIASCFLNPFPFIYLTIYSTSIQRFHM